MARIVDLLIFFLSKALYDTNDDILGGRHRLCHVACGNFPETKTGGTEQVQIKSEQNHDCDKS